MPGICSKNICTPLDLCWGVCHLFYMSKIIKSVVRAVKQIRGLFPSKLPQGVTEFNNWAKDIQTTYDLPTQEQDSILFSLAAAIMHSGSHECYKSKYYFVTLIRAGAAKQLAGFIFSDIKERQKAVAQAAKLAAEVTAQQAVTDESQKQAI